MVTILAALEGSAILAALWLMELVGSSEAAAGTPHVLGAVGIPGVLAASAVAALYYSDCYSVRRGLGLPHFLPRLARGIALALVPAGLCYALAPQASMAVAATLVLMVAVPAALRGVVDPVLRSGWFAERVLIVGSGPLVQKVADAIREHGLYRYRTVGVLDEGRHQAPAPWLRRRPLGALDRLLDAARPQRIVVARGHRRDWLPLQPFLEARLRNIVVEDGADFYERLTGKIAIEAHTPASLIFANGFRRCPFTVAAARALSLVVAAVGLILLAPLLGVIALLIKLESTSSVFFRQERVGLGGRPFTLIKFRTMREGEPAPSEWARDNGHRITRVGRWLRAFRLDELPQFVNVLKGDMNIVGPRPHPVSNFSLFVTVLRNSPECGEQIPYYSLRSMVRPGITGWAQVRYQYANTLEEEIEKMRYDLYYVKHRSLWLDLRIIAATVKTVLAGRGDAAPEEGRPPRLPAPASWPLAARPR